MGIGGADETAIEFRGDWHDFIPIALTNTVLTIVTLGIYRFWAKTRERRYLWSKTRFIDDQLEWTGTGLELFLGFVVALFVFGIPYIAYSILSQRWLLQGDVALFVGVTISFFLFFFYLAGFAVYRGLRYKLTRTFWHGIRGGSDEPGFKYGLSYLWRTIVGVLPIGLLIPWASAALWKERWESMSFGPHHFVANPQWKTLMKRFLLFYIGPTLLALGGAYAGFNATSVEGSAPMVSGLIIFFAVIFYIALPLIGLIYYALYLRVMVSSLKLSTLDFSFTARSLDWFILWLGNVGIMILAYIVGLIAAGIFGGGMMALFSDFEAVKMGAEPPVAMIGSIALIIFCFAIPLMLVGPFIRYRTWAFFVRYLEVGGEVNLTTLTQSKTADLKQGEGLLDAFDMGAI